MFVFRRSVAPAFGFMVMNRLAIDHFFESLVPEMEVQITEAYIYYRNPRGFLLFFFSLSFSFSFWILFFFLSILQARSMACGFTTLRRKKNLEISCGSKGFSFSLLFTLSHAHLRSRFVLLVVVVWKTCRLSQKVIDDRMARTPQPQPQPVFQQPRSLSSSSLVASHSGSLLPTSSLSPQLSPSGSSEKVDIMSMFEKAVQKSAVSEPLFVLICAVSC